jgi:hypothetical protein
MSKGPEANFWNTIRNSLPKKAFATRIENKHGGGVPDVHIVWDGKPFWLELKVSKSNSVNVSPHQVAWNMAYWARGGLSFYLVKAPSTSLLYLFEGDQGPNLASSGLSGSEGQEFKNLAALWEYLAGRLAG